MLSIALGLCCDDWPGFVRLIDDGVGWVGGWLDYTMEDGGRSVERTRGDACLGLAR